MRATRMTAIWSSDRTRHIYANPSQVRILYEQGAVDYVCEHCLLLLEDQTPIECASPLSPHAHHRWSWQMRLASEIRLRGASCTISASLLLAYVNGSPYAVAVVEACWNPRSAEAQTHRNYEELFRKVKLAKRERVRYNPITAQSTRPQRVLS